MIVHRTASNLIVASNAIVAGSDIQDARFFGESANYRIRQHIRWPHRSCLMIRVPKQVSSPTGRSRPATVLGSNVGLESKQERAQAVISGDAKVMLGTLGRRRRHGGGNAND